ncbi:sodium/hydrogen exchanger 3 protein [Sesbania bispinosa]|nr:sodium/hydrogen exchanger 3 protein [Sesbania bispinosa]
MCISISTEQDFQNIEPIASRPGTTSMLTQTVFVHPNEEKKRPCSNTAVRRRPCRSVAENSQGAVEEGGLKRAGSERDEGGESGEGRQKQTVMRENERGHDARWETMMERDGAR